MDSIVNQAPKKHLLIPHRTNAIARSHVIPKTQRTEICPHCKGAGYLRVDVPCEHPQFGKPVPCQCNIEQTKLKELQQLIDFSGLSTLKRFRAASFSTYDPFVPGVREAFLQTFEFACQPSGWLVIIGEYGCGKTHLAVSIAKKQIEMGNLVLFQVVPRLLDYLRASFSPEAEQDYDKRFRQLCEVNMLILDDLGSQNNTPWANDKLFQLLNYRYNAYAPTVITMNAASWQQLEPRLHSRFMDRHLVHLIKMNQVQDYRIHGN